MYTIKAIHGDAYKPQKIGKLLRQLSTVPERISEALRAAARAGTCTVLA